MTHPAADEAPSKAPSSRSAPLREHDAVTIPERSLDDWGVALLLFAGSCLYLRLFYNHYPSLTADEGIYLQGAQRILQGQVLYRDFFTLYTPGTYYWIALLFKVFGSSILVPRAALVIYGGLYSVFTYLIARRVCGRWTALFVAYLVSLTCLPFTFMARHNWESTLWACCALYCAVRWLESRHRVWPMATASFAALTCLFEQSKGAGLVMGLAAGMALLVGLDRTRRFLDRQRLAVLTAGFAWPFGLTFAYFAIKHSLPQMLAGWFWPLRYYAGVEQFPYGYLPTAALEWQKLPWAQRAFTLFALSPAFLVPVLPLLAPGIVVWRAVRMRRRQDSGPRDSYYVLVSAVLSGLLLSILVSNRNFDHILVLSPLFYIVLAWFLGGCDICSRILNHAKPLVVLYLFLSFTIFGLLLLTARLKAGCRLETRRGALNGGIPDGVLGYADAHLPAGSKIFVYPYQPLYYYLTATFNPTGYDFFIPGLNPPSQLEDAVRQLDADHTPAVLFIPSFNEIFAAGYPALSPEILAAKNPVVDYIVDHYRQCAQLSSQGSWPYLYMVRKDLPCPRD